MTPTRLATLLLLPLLLTGCLFSPGKFAADMTIARNGDFSFAYRGEIFMAGIGQLVRMGEALDKQDEMFVPSPCYREEDVFDANLAAAAMTGAVQDEDVWDDTNPERECTEQELEDQREAWEASRAAKRADDERNMRMFEALLGGIDPSSPEAVDELIVRLKKQRGWTEVTHKGDGLFEVDYSVDGRFGQDFSFPTIERMAGLPPFLTAIVRDSGAVRIDAPGFAAAGTGPFAGMGGLFPFFQAMAQSEGAGDDFAELALPELDGTFTIRTDANILTNNTEDGPTLDNGWRVLSWAINPRRTNAPEALIQLDDR